MLKRRQSDGRFRGVHAPSRPSERTIRARWVESEVLKLKLLGVSTFHAIAQQITRVGRGEAQPAVEFPLGLKFPPNYSISDVACWRACQKALARGPRLRAQEMRDIDSDRLEDAILAIQKSVKQGNPAASQSLSRLITTKARLNGYLAAQKLEVTGRSGGPIEVKGTDDAELSKMLERLTRDEQIEFLRLFNKARGIQVDSAETEDAGREDVDEQKIKS